MLYVFNKSSVGYSHTNIKKECQDYSASYRDNDRVIISCCDGHGGKIYVRSSLGSIFASYAIVNVFNSINSYYLSREEEKELERKIKLDILCEWNRMVETHLSHKPIRKSELVNFTDEEIEEIKLNPVRLYGTTLTGALVINNKLVVIGIGDSECIGIKKGKMERLLEDENEPCGNFTYSMCQEDAFSRLKVRVLNFKDYDGVILCTDGLSRPYQSYINLHNSFIKPLVEKILTTSSVTFLDTFIDNLASSLGVGDDVSISLILKSEINIDDYR